MTEPLIIGDAQLYRGDAIKVMTALVEAGVRADMLCSDPPYLLTSGGQTEGGIHERLGGAGYDNGGHLVACDLEWNDFMPWFFRMMERGHAYVMANNRNVQPMLNAAEKAGFEFHNLLVWDKVSATPNRWYMKNIEFTGLFYKGKAIAINDCSSMSCIRYPHADESDHPTEKPVALMEMYIRNSTQPGDLVMDPFMGSGTTGVAAIRAGRRFIGIELDERWHGVAAKRIRKALEHGQSRLL
jgi:site-specific DNA-methyltransferase (adenine-specific)